MGAARPFWSGCAHIAVLQSSGPLSLGVVLPTARDSGPWGARQADPHAHLCREAAMCELSAGPNYIDIACRMVARARCSRHRVCMLKEEAFAHLVSRQAGMVSRRQLRAIGVTKSRIAAQVSARRWTLRTPTVVSAFTGDLSWFQQCWLGVLQAGRGAIIGGVAAGQFHGLQNWHRDSIDVLVPANSSLERIPGIRWVRTRRRLQLLREPGTELPVARIEPALLIFGGADRSARTAMGCLAAAVQQSLSTPERIGHWIEALRPLRRSALLRACVADMAGGAQSVGELDSVLFRAHNIKRPDRQVCRRDASGRSRFLDCCWTLPNGRTLVLEIDGGFHMSAMHWQADVARARDLADPSTIIVRCTTVELRDDPASIASSLIRLGVPRAHTPGSCS